MSFDIDDIGIFFMIGLPGQTLDDTSKRIIDTIHPGGIILLRRNLSTPENVIQLKKDIEKRLNNPVLLSIDHEGGMIIRFSEGTTHFPGNRALGEIYDPDLACQQGQIMAEELSNWGITINLAPVLDILASHYNPGITIRSFGKDPDLVSSLGSAFIEGLHNGGIAATAKHFPGKGASRVDAHLDLPTIDLDRKEMDLHIKPFAKAINSGVDLVMSSHVMYPKLDSRNPASFSKSIITGILRDELLFDKTAISDDLEMGAIEKHFPIDKAAVKAFNAGHDILLLCSDPEKQMAAFKAFENAIDIGEIPLKKLHQSKQRISSLVENLSKRSNHTNIFNTGSSSILAENIAYRSIKQSCNNLNSATVHSIEDLVILFPSLDHLHYRYALENSLLEGGNNIFEDYNHHKSQRYIYNLEEIPNYLNYIGHNSRRVLFFCFDAMFFPSQEKILNALRPGKDIAVLMRNPEDEVLVPEGVSIIKSYGFREVQIRTVMNLILNH
ncbi:MAG: beta-N-acetylhexosaminidase [Candidatus Theseobacter exili]|nr:beta-N-acetylhexosaminidase [Candidatus Theseobacter exili]